MRLTVLDRACLSFHQTCQSWSLQACPDVCKFYAFLSPDVLVRGKVAKACVATLLGSRLEEASEEKRKRKKRGKSCKGMSGNIAGFSVGRTHQRKRGKGGKRGKVAITCLATLVSPRVERSMSAKTQQSAIHMRNINMAEAQVIWWPMANNLKGDRPNCNM